MLFRILLGVGFLACLIAAGCGGDSSEGGVVSDGSGVTSERDVAGSLLHPDLAQEYRDECDGWEDDFAFSDAAGMFEDCDARVAAVWAAAGNLEETGPGSEGPEAERALRECLWWRDGKRNGSDVLSELATTEAGSGLQEPAALSAEYCLTSPTPAAVLESVEPRVGRALTEDELECYLYQYDDISRNFKLKDALIVDIADRTEVHTSSRYDLDCLSDEDEGEG